MPRIKRVKLIEDDECSAGSFYVVTYQDGTQGEVTAEKMPDIIREDLKELAIANNNC
jgi:hypothetical protein